MVSAGEALRVVLTISQRLPLVTVPRHEGLGLVLAEDVRAPDPLPPYRASIKEMLRLKLQRLQLRSKLLVLCLRCSKRVSRLSTCPIIQMLLVRCGGLDASTLTCFEADKKGIKERSILAMFCMPKHNQWTNGNIASRLQLLVHNAHVLIDT